MTRKDDGGHYSVVWPRSERQRKLQPLARRLDTLNSKTVAELWDYRYRGNEVYRMLEEDLTARFPDVQFVNWAEFGTTYGWDEREMVATLPKRFEALGVDAAISSMGC